MSPDISAADLETFRAAFVAYINANSEKPPAILELGSGLLAEAILARCNVASYTLLAQSCPPVLGGKLLFLQRDFKTPEWDADLGPFDMVVSLLAVHDLGGLHRVPVLYWQIHDVLWDGGVFLVADHYAGGPSALNPALYMSRAAQREALESAGFDRVESLLDLREAALLAARKWD